MGEHNDKPQIRRVPDEPIDQELADKKIRFIRDAIAAAENIAEATVYQAGCSMNESSNQKQLNW